MELVNFRFPDGSSVPINSEIANNLHNLCASAWIVGIKLGALSGYRTRAEQEAIWKTDPAGASPPGYSKHEEGVAIDFANCETSSTRTSLWLRLNAVRFGGRGDPIEPWHFVFTPRLM